jgi:hypothetical protein
MDKFAVILDLLKDYDAVSIVFIVMGYLIINNKISVVDKAVNQRPEGSATISDDVTTIKNDIQLIIVDLKHVKEEVDAHRDIDEAAFLRIENDIRLINSKI